MKLLFTLSVTSETAAAAEKFLDFIRQLGGKRGHLVLAIMSNVHDEMKSRIRISASLAFDAVHELNLLPLADAGATAFAQRNNIFGQVSRHITKCFQWPFLWLDSNCTPTHHKWMDRLWEAYSNQPSGYFGSRMMMKAKPGVKESRDIFFMAEVGIYPCNASDTMIANPESAMPINIEFAGRILDRMGMTKMIQQASIGSEGDLLSVRDDAILVTGDRNGFLRQQVFAVEASRVREIKESAQVVTGPIFSEPEPVAVHVTPPKRQTKPKVSQNGVRQ